MRDYIQLTKPRITWLILMSTGVGFYFGASPVWSWSVLIHTIVGTGLIASGTAALNQWWERDADTRKCAGRNSARCRRMESVPEARCGSPLRFPSPGSSNCPRRADELTAWLGLFTLATYLFVYTTETAPPCNNDDGALLAVPP